MIRWSLWIMFIYQRLRMRSRLLNFLSHLWSWIHSYSVVCILRMRNNHLIFIERVLIRNVLSYIHCVPFSELLTDTVALFVIEVWFQTIYHLFLLLHYQIVLLITHWQVFICAVYAFVLIMLVWIHSRRNWILDRHELDKVALGLLLDL